MSEPLVPNSDECLFLRCWYKVKGCEAPFTTEGRALIQANLTAHYSLGFDPASIREEVIKAFINSTARVTPVRSLEETLDEEGEPVEKVKKPKKEKERASLEKFLAILDGLTKEKFSTKNC